MSTLVVLDTETTGLEPGAAAIVEIAAVAVRDGQIVDRFSTLVWPGREFLQREHRHVLDTISGINVLDLLDTAVPDATGAEALLQEWAARATEGQIRVTSFNVWFDRKFLQTDPWSLDLWSEPGITWAPCLMLAAMEPMGKAGALQRHWRGGWKWPSLAEACAHFGIERQNAHRALGDAEAAARIAIALQAA